jgi:predicted GNAT superfamily acetyltransferase
MVIGFSDKLKEEEEFLLAVVNNDTMKIKSIETKDFDNMVLIDATGIILSHGYDEMKNYLLFSDSRFAFLFQNFNKYIERYNDIIPSIP